MHPHNLVILVTLLSILLYFFMILRVGAARGKSGIEAPAVTGDPVFERTYRVQMNTLEQLPVYLVSLWVFTAFWDQRIAAAAGAVWIVGRLIYLMSYVKDPKTRSLGFGISGIAVVVLFVGAVWGVVKALIATGGV